MSTLSPEDYAYQLADINNDRGPVLVGVSTMFLVLGMLAVVGRFVARRMVRAKLAPDDYLVLFSLLCLIGLTTELYVLVHYGVGQHVITLSIEAGTIVGQTTFALQVTYVFLVVAVKLSILFLYRRLFTMRKTYFRIGWWVCIIYLAGFFIAVMTVILTSCNPISSFWNLSGPVVCRVSWVPSVVFGVLNAVSDTMVLCLPTYVVWNLHLPLKQRAATLGIFLLGSFVIIVSCLRIPSLKSAATGVDATFEEVDGFIWTTAECSVGLICACLPVMWPLLRGFGEKLRTHATNSSHSSHWRIIQSHDVKPLHEEGRSEGESYGSRSWAEGGSERDLESSPAIGSRVHVTHSFQMDRVQPAVEKGGKGYEEHGREIQGSKK